MVRTTTRVCLLGQAIAVVAFALAVHVPLVTAFTGSGLAASRTTFRRTQPQPEPQAHDARLTLRALPVVPRNKGRRRILMATTDDENMDLIDEENEEENNEFDRPLDIYGDGGDCYSDGLGPSMFGLEPKQELDSLDGGLMFIGPMVLAFSLYIIALPFLE
jgi:hypothetical protein